LLPIQLVCYLMLSISIWCHIPEESWYWWYGYWYWSIIIDSVQRSVDSDFIYHFDNIIDINNREAEFSCYWLLSLRHKHADIDNVIDINNREGRVLCYWLLLLLHININITIQISIICGLVSAYQKVPKTESYLFLWELLGKCSYHPPREKNWECWKSSVLFFIVPRYSSYISVLLYSKSSTPE